MQKIGLWQISEGSPQKLNIMFPELERHLEEWIENDPSLLQAGLRVVGRQVKVEGGFIDLLALNPNGRWVVIEIKKGDVCRDTIAQALDYASSLDMMSTMELSEKSRIVPQ